MERASVSVVTTPLASLSGAGNGNVTSLRNVVVPFKKVQQEEQSTVSLDRARGAISRARARSRSRSLDQLSSRSNSLRRTSSDLGRVNQNSWDGNEHVAAPVWPEQQAGQVADSPSLASASTSGARSRPASPELRARRSNSKEQNDGEKQLALWTEYLVEKHLARQRQERFVKNKILLSTQRLSTSVLDDQQHIDILIRIDAVASAFSNPQQVCSSLRQAYSNSQREIELLTLQLKRIENLESALNCLLADDDKLSEDGVVEVAAQREVEQFTQAAAEAQSSKADVDSMQKAELLDSAAMKL